MFFRDRKSSTAPKGAYPLLPLRELVVFPHMPMSLIVGRPRSVAALTAAAKNRREIVLVAQKNGERIDPAAEDLYEFGTIATIEQSLQLPDGHTKIHVEGRRRCRILRWVENPDFFEVEVEEFEPSQSTPEIAALARQVKGTFERYVKLNRAVPPEMMLAVNALEDADRLADSIVLPLNFKVAERQELLEVIDVHQRLERVHKALLTEIEFLQVDKKVKTRARREKEVNQREFWLNDQMKAIQKELGDKEGRGELEELTQQLAAKEMSDAVRDRAQKELRKLAQMNLMSAEATVVRNYLDWVLALPWVEKSEPAESEPAKLLEAAARVLDEDHYGLRKAKERVLEYLAVSSLVERQRGPILCFVGPPGVGKTSLARSIARATGRPFARIALGGVRDEAEIRGHRRTYIGAMPGKILHAMKRAGKVDPVILLDEVDKMSADFRGDPAAALLEVLDPEQNQAFNDHYMDMDFDLSHVTFICTANTLQGIPLPMQDRLEILEIPGYTEAEKLGIARRYLLPKAREQNGLTVRNLELSDAAIQKIVQVYTKEAGVRDLERQIARISRKVARKVVRDGHDVEVKIGTSNLEKVLGARRFDVQTREESDQVGLVKGLSVSAVGGEMLNIEVCAVPGKGKLVLTGKLGDTLKESAQAAFTYIRSRADALHLDPDFHEKYDFHVHYPGVPYGVEGPSAGIAMAVALTSALTGIPVRADTAMTGEITLRGRVLRIGGLKDKVLAAHRGGIARVLIPESNAVDLEDIPPNIREAVEIVTVGHMDRVLLEALAGADVARLLGTYGRGGPIAVDSDQAARPADPANPSD